MSVSNGVLQNEAKQDRGSSDGQSEAKHAPVNMKNLDELLNFINGTDSDGAKVDSNQSSRAAKRARQKQRKVSVWHMHILQLYVMVGVGLVSQLHKNLYVGICL